MKQAERKTTRSFKMKDGMFRQKAIKHKGVLRKALHVKEGEKIPEKKIKIAEQSKNPVMRRRTNLAETLSKLRKKK